MKLKYCLCPLLFIPGVLFASKVNEYPIGEITDSLKRNAAAVVRLDNVTINVQNIHHYTYAEEKVVSILNSSKENLADVFVEYNELLSSIKSFKAWVYDADGKMVKHLDKSDGTDYSATPGYVLAGTERVKYWDLKKLKAPFTIKYSYEKEESGTFQFPDWAPAPTYGVSIEQASLHVNSSEGVAINYKTAGLADNNPNKQKLSWDISGFSAVKKTEYSSHYRNSVLPHVLLMAKEFEIYGYKGSSATWNDIGVFMNTLMRGRGDLGTYDDAKLDDIIKSTSDDREKVRLIYKYLQNNFRYVCISLGIGGWQPQEASFTAQKKYGDCKALSFVMKAMLQKAGIESCLTLVTAGPDLMELDPDFPHSYFNHAILCVPLPNDTIWLECTSAVDPFNYLGSFTSNRRALMIFNGGARVVQTPDYAEKENISYARAQIKLNDDNTVSIKGNVVKQSELQDGLRSTIDLKDAKNIESALYESAHLKNTTINSYSITKVEPDKPEVSFALDLKNESAIKKTESRIFINADLFSPISSIPEKNEHRTQSVYVNRGYTQLDTLVYTLPTGYMPENFKPEEERDFTEQFGYARCSLKYVAEKGELIMVRKFCLKQAIYPADQFQSLREFLLKSMKQCCPDLVLKKQG